MEDNVITINCLPNELISIILQNNDCREILCFASTCKRFNEMVIGHQMLWKDVFNRTLPLNIFEVVDQHCGGDWLNEMKRFFKLRQQVHKELISMSPLCYWRTADITLADIRNFFAIALRDNLSYYYTINVLQDIIRKGKKKVDELKCQKPFTLTEMYYAKVALRHLIQTYLAVKWVKLHVKEELTPEIVLNFFLQWIDTDSSHSDEDVENKINELAERVKNLLETKSPMKSKSTSDEVNEKCVKAPVNDRKVLAAVTEVIYRQRHMAVASAANLDTLDILKVLDNKCGNVIALAIIYQAVTKRFGVKCNLIVFPNHLFLEWRENSQEYTVDLQTGQLHRKGRCPFSQNPNSKYKYYPDSLLQYIYSSFHRTMGAIKNWNTQNALHLLDFLGTYDNDQNPYSNFLPYLLDLTHLPAMNVPLDLKYLRNEQIQIISSLSHLNIANASGSRSVAVKNHEGHVRFAVGMVCYHKKYEYVCVVRGWDLTCAGAAEWQRRMEVDSLEFGARQPFYHVVAADQSERYVAQENLTEVIRPTRLYHLEELIAREFTHFDGFAYVPNDEKRFEYPGDESVAGAYRTRSELAAPPRAPDH